MHIEEIISIGVVIIFAIAGLYVGGWLMFAQPILDMCIQLDAGTLTATVVGITILKCIFASTVGTIVFFVGVFISDAIIDHI